MSKLWHILKFPFRNRTIINPPYPPPNLQIIKSRRPPPISSATGNRADTPSLKLQLKWLWHALARAWFTDKSNRMQSENERMPKLLQREWNWSVINMHAPPVPRREQQTMRPMSPPPPRTRTCRTENQSDDIPLIKKRQFPPIQLLKVTSCGHRSLK